MTESDRHFLLMHGRAHQRYGEIVAASTPDARTACVLSVGSDPKSPGRRSKLSDEDLNEDGLLVVEQGPTALLAIADAHFGSESSEHLLRELERLCERPPANPQELRRLLERIEPGDTNRLSASTLLLAVHDRVTGRGFGLSFGDSSLVLVGRGGARLVNTHNSLYLAPADYLPMPFASALDFQFESQQDDLVLAFSDGINECHYREPESSLQAEHLEQLYRQHGPNPQAYARAAVEWALRGVDGHPGGQDNVALIARGAGSN